MKILAEQAATKLSKTKRRLTVLAFDELNVLREMESFYAWFLENTREWMDSLFRARFKEVYRWLNDDDEPDEDIVDTLVALELTKLLDEPNQATHYAYVTELYRKRDRAVEAIESCPTKAEKQIELQKQIKYVMQQTAWYMDFASQDAEIDAFVESGIQYVKRHEVMDRRTCQECKDADGDVYPINQIPPIPHLRCRRWFTKA